MSKDVGEKVCRVLEESQAAVINTLLKAGFSDYSSEIDAMYKKGLISKCDRSLFYNAMFGGEAKIIDILGDSITEIAIIISELNCWDVDYRDEIKKHLNNVQSEVFYEAIWDDLIERIEKIKAKFLDFIASNLTNSNLYGLSIDEAKNLSKDIFKKVDIVKKADYMTHNRWYDKDWYDATSIKSIMLNKYLFGKTKKFEYLEKENNDNMRNSYAIASKSVYQMMFGTKKRDKLVGTKYGNLLKYINAFNPGENLYALMLSDAIPALSGYRKFEDNAERISAAKKQLDEKWIGKQTKVNECVLKAMTYPTEDVGYVPGRITSTVLSRWLREYGYEVDYDKENSKKNKNNYKKNIAVLRIVSDSELQDIIKKHILLIPKVLTLRLGIELSELNLSNNPSAQIEIDQRTDMGNFTDYLFDVIVYDENFVLSLNGNPIPSDTCSEQEKLQVEKIVEKYLGDKKEEAKKCCEKCNNAIKKCEKEREKREKERKKRGDRIKKHKERKSKLEKDIWSKNNRIIKKCEFYTKNVIKKMKGRWVGTNGLEDSVKDIGKLEKRIQISILLIAYYLSEDFEKFDEFVRKGKINIKNIF